jgi:hypothetical protein
MPLILTRNAKALQESAGLRVRNAVITTSQVHGSRTDS